APGVGARLQPVESPIVLKEFCAVLQELPTNLDKGVMPAWFSSSTPVVGFLRYCCSREDAKVGVELVAGFATIFKVVTVTDGEKAHVTRQGHALRGMNGVPAGHGIVHRRVGDIGVGRRLTRHVEVDGIVHDAPALSHLVELDALYLDRQETLARDHVPAEVVPGAGGGKWRVVGVTG